MRPLVNDTVPLDHVDGPPSVMPPAPVSVPARVIPPSSVPVPATTSVPLTVNASVASTECTFAVVVGTVTVMVAAGRLITTTSPLPGIALSVHLVGSSQEP